MNIKFVPQDKNYPKDKPVLTNVGEFLPGQILSMQPYQEKEARRLIANGDFVESTDAPEAEKKATPAPEVGDTVDDQIAGKKRK